LVITDRRTICQLILIHIGNPVHKVMERQHIAKGNSIQIPFSFDTITDPDPGAKILIATIVIDIVWDQISEKFIGMYFKMIGKAKKSVQGLMGAYMPMELRRILPQKCLYLFRDYQAPKS